MKRIHFIIISLLCSVATMAQKSFPGSDRINPEIKKLMKSLDSLRISTEWLFDRDAKRSVRFMATPVLYVEADDTIKQADALRKTWRNNRFAHEAIMKTIKQLAHESTVTNHYEAHKNGMDTIEVTAVLNKAKDEYLEYRLRSFTPRSAIYNSTRAFPKFEYNLTIDDNAKAYKFVDVDDFLAKVKPFFLNANVLSCHKAVYEHDGDCKNGNMFVKRQNHLDGDALYNSRTEATIYKITGRKKVAMKILNQLIDLVWKYTDKHNDVSYYEFQPFAKFTDSSTTELIQFVSASKNKGTIPQSFQILLYKEPGKEVYYFAFLKTDGDLWLPLDWTTVEHSKLTNNPKEGNITGVWKCSDQTLRNLGIDYDKMSGKIELKADSTFTMTAKGRGVGGHNFWSHRTVSVKVNGIYSIKGDSISFDLKRDNIKCHINDDVMDNDPKLGPTPAYKHQQEHSTWDAADRRYETAKDQGSMQEEFLKDEIHKAMPFGASITFIDSKTIQIGSTIYLTR